MRMYNTVHAYLHISVNICTAYTYRCMYGHAVSNTDRARPRRAALRRPKAAHTACNVVTDAVFHAPMFALNAVADQNACEPDHTQFTPIESARKFGADTACWRRNLLARARTHAQTQHKLTHVTHSHTPMPTWTHTCAPVSCMHASVTHTAMIDRNLEVLSGISASPLHMYQ